MPKDYYDILGVSKSAGAEEIKRAFRKKAHEHHPDKNGGNAEKFKEVNQAYQVLGDEQKRKQYDQYGSAFEDMPGGGFRSQGQNPFEGYDFGGFNFDEFSATGGSAFGGDLGDIFGDFFGGRREHAERSHKGIDLEMNLTVFFAEAVFGVEKDISLEKKDKCQVCKGTGAEDGKTLTCPKCHGQGQIRTTRRTIFGNIASASTCDHCEGLGKVPQKPCRECGGRGFLRQAKTLRVKIPAGIDDGQSIRVGGEGEAGYRGSSAGDLFLRVRVMPQKDFKRDGVNLYTEMPVSFTQAALGAKLEIETLDGRIELKIPAGTQSGAQFRLKSKGVPYLNNASKRGDLILTARVIVPSKLSKREKELLKQIAEERGETVEVDETFWQNIKDSF